MGSALIKWILLALSLMFTAWAVPGIEVSGFWVAMIACVIIALVNVLFKPFLLFISLPINLVTIGLFTFIINALLFMLSAWLMPGLEVEGFLSALLGSIVFSVFSTFISKM